MKDAGGRGSGPSDGRSMPVAGQGFAESVRYLVWDWDICTNLISWNEEGSAAAVYGLPPGRVPLTWWEERVHPDDLERVSHSLAAAVAAADRFSADYRLRRADGTWAQVYGHGFIIRNGEGQAVRMLGSLQDHSDHHAAVAALRVRESQLATIFGQAMVGIMHLDANGRVLMVNSRFCEILGRPESQVRRESFEDWTHPDDLAWNQSLFRHKMEQAESFQIEKRYVRGDGNPVRVAVHVSFVGEPGSVSGLIVVAEDVTARHQAEQALEAQKGLLQSVVDSVSDFIFVKAADGRFILTNRALDENCGPLTGRRTSDAFEDDLVAGYEGVDADVIASGELREVEEVIPIKGEPRLFETVKVPWVKDGETAGVIGVSRDITQRKCVELALRESELLYRSVLQASADCIKILSPDGQLQLMNDPGVCAMELDGFEAVRGASWPSLWPEDMQAVAASAVSEAASGKASRFTGFCPTAKGNDKWWDVVVTPMTDADGRIVRLLCISRDVTASRETSEQLRWTSDHDVLTGLPNRRAFQAHLQAATIRAMERGGMLGLLLLDLDHFKHVNDSLGHAAGDHLLKTFGGRLKKSVRATDFVARLGGDEFAVVLEGVGAEADLMKAGKSILSRLQAPIRLEGRVLSAGASIGGALFPRDAGTANELFKNADTALYALKGSGRGGTRMFHQYMRDHAKAVATQLSQARIAVSEKSVIPHYQRKVDLTTSRTMGFEALLRWRHPTRGIQLPDTVSEAFKDYELAARIGELMQAKVAADIRSWRGNGFEFGRVSINAAPAEFLRDDYAERLLERLERADVPTDLIEIEVTEHAFVERSAEQVERALRTLSGAGVRIALDDFGTGSSSLSHLRDFPVDVVKIDRSFIARMEEEPEISAIVSAVIGLASSLSIEVVAEGIETQAQMALLLEKGCRIGQGFLFGRPIPNEQIAIVGGSRARAA